MFLRLAITAMFLVFTTGIKTSIQSKRSNLNLGGSESALVPPQEVSVDEKNKVLKAIKSLYGPKEPVDYLNFVKMSSGDGSRGVVLRERNGKLYLLTNPCDRDWHEMDILVYSRPYEIKKGIENRYCEIRKIRLKIAEVKQK